MQLFFFLISWPCIFVFIDKFFLFCFFLVAPILVTSSSSVSLSLFLTFLDKTYFSYFQEKIIFLNTHCLGGIHPYCANVSYRTLLFMPLS